MRLYCLASISRISPDESNVKSIPYETGADGNGKLRSTLEKLPSDYRLTEICIGYEEYAKKRIYVIQIYQTNSELIDFNMRRSFVKMTYLNDTNTCFDLRLATSKISELNPSFPSSNFDLTITCLCIRNTSTRGHPTVQEEEAFKSHAEKINNFCNENSHMTPKNLRMDVIQKFGALTLLNQSTPKVFRQKLIDFQSAIDLLCNPQNGSYKNMQELDKSCRFNQKAQNLLFKAFNLTHVIWRADRPRKPVHMEMNKYRNTPELRWKNVILDNRTNFDAFNFQYLKGIQFEKVHLGTSMEYWYKLAEKINFKQINFICLRDCGIKRLDDEFFKHLTPKLGGLRLMDNDITFISKKISKLTNLFYLDLNGNVNLTEDGIPWDYLPSSIRTLNLFNTDITKVPNKSRKIIKELNVSSSKLHHIEWTGLRDKSSWSRGGPGKLHLYGNGTQINDVVLKSIEINDLVISDLKFTKFEPFRSSFSSLHLKNNGLKNLEIAGINFTYLQELTISKNGLKTFSWKQLPDRIRRLHLSHNELERISAPEDGEIDFSFFDQLEEISFEGNAINFLPNGFENLPKLKKLNLSCNRFGNDNALLSHALWERLPKSLTSLNLNFNKIHSIPCCLKNFNIQNLYIVKTDLRYICPYLHTNVQKTGNYMVIDAFANPFLKHSFVPNTIYHLPLASVKSTTGKPLYPYGDTIPNYANFSTTTIFAEEKPLRDTSKISNKTKSVYIFKPDEVENVYACKCCAICGDKWCTKSLEVPPLFKQIMAMDSILLIKKEEGIEGSNYAKFNSPFQPPIYFEPGQWRCKITSRLCSKCMQVIKSKIDAAFEKYKTNHVKPSSPALQQKLYNPSFPGSSSSSKYIRISSNEVFPLSFTTSVPGSLSSVNILPPIATFINHKHQASQYIAAKNNNTSSVHNSAANNLTTQTISIDQFGRYSCTFDIDMSSDNMLSTTESTPAHLKTRNKHLKRAATTTDNQPSPKNPRTHSSTINGYNFAVL